MWVEDYKWHYDYVRLAWDTGFSFDKCKSPNLDKNKICVVDIDQIVRERDVGTVDRHISTVVQYILDDEQAKVLDTNFVKIFRLSQLTVDFLLFCKKYLDNTVVLLKRELAKDREENKELKTFVNDLQSHIDTLTRQQTLATFKCSMCLKAFSSEEYLNAHLKRRHNNSETYNVETDKLNLEIKQLKERLNNTEKLLRDKEEQSFEKGVYDSGTNTSKMNELLDKFERFKENIDCELKEIKMQKSFYEENYGRLFNIMVNKSKENIEPKYDNTKEILMAETTTQTDKLLHMENLYNRNVLEIQEPLSPNKSKVLHENESNLKETKERIEDKISITLAGIEDQMQAFWNKLNELENTKTIANAQLESNQTEDIVTSENARPKIKPRSKFSQPTHNSRVIGNNAETLKLAISQLEQEQNALEKKTHSKHKEMSVNKNTKLASDHCISKITSILPSDIAFRDVSDQTKLEKENLNESEASESDSFSSVPKNSVLVEPLTSVLGRQSITSLNKISSDKEVLKNLNKEIKEVVGSRIQELGISKSWPGIPQRSFQKSLEILNHQATLTKRTYSNFDFLKKKINDDVEKHCAKTNSKIKLKTSPKRQKIGKAQNIVKISYRRKSSKPKTNERIVDVNSKRETIEIKNRALYETDSESEKTNNAHYTRLIASGSQPHRMYSDVVKEFKSLSTSKLHNDDDTDVDDLNKKEDLQKGVLKSFPSVGSLSKKKVLFDLDKSSKKENVPVIQKTGGSTTSIASSILEQSIKDTDEIVKYTESYKTNNEEKNDNRNKEKELNDLSDLDFSDL